MNNKMVKRIIFIVCLALNFFIAADQTDYSKILEANIDPSGPGSAVIVTQGDKTLYLGARGMANIELGSPLNPQSVFRLGSITKQFTSAAIMVLAEKEQLSVTDNIRKFVPDFPTDGHDVTIEQLLAHTSGLANYTDNPETMTKRIQESISLDEMLELFANEQMLFAPGESWRYSNTGYVLLGKIIEQVSGQSYADFVQQNIFDKLDMSNSHYGGRQIIRNRALGYTTTANGVENAALIDMSWPHAAGSLLSNVEDLNKWFRNLKDGNLLTQDSYKEMIQPYSLNDGSVTDYGYGFRIYKINKYDAIGHGGGIPGFNTSSFYLPEKDIFIAVFNNIDSRGAGLLGLKFAAKALDIALPEFTPVAVSEKTLKSFIGNYQLASGGVRTLSVEDGIMYSQRDEGRKFPVIPMSDNSFYYENSLTYFVIEPNDEGKLTMKFYTDLAVSAEIASRD